MIRGLGPSPGGRAPRFRRALGASFLLHTILFFVPAAVWQKLPGLGPRGDDGQGGGRPLVVAFYDPGPPGEEEVAAPASGAVPEPSATDPEPAPASPATRTAPPPPSPPASALVPAEGVGGVSRPGDAVSGSPPPGDLPGFEEDGEAQFHPPRLLTGALPIDPEEIEDLEVPEEIPVRILVGRDGRVLRIEPVATDLPEMVREALVRSARAMRFVPARQGGDAVEAWFPMTFIYDPGS